MTNLNSEALTPLLSTTGDDIASGFRSLALQKSMRAPSLSFFGLVGDGHTIIIRCADKKNLIHSSCTCYKQLEHIGFIFTI